MNQIANDIYNQLGGGRFAAMTGAKGFIWDNGKQLLRILLSKNGSKANRLDVIYNSDDTYTMHFYRYAQEKIKIDYEKQEVRTIPEKNNRGKNI